MRILLYGLNFSPELTGVGKYSGEMASWLAARGHEVEVITAPPYYPHWRVAHGYGGLRWTVERPGSRGGPTVRRAPLWVPRKVSGLTRLLHLMSFAASSVVPLIGALRRRPDVLFVVAPTLFCAPAGLLAARVCGVPAWLHVQDFEVDAMFGLGLMGGASSVPGRFARGCESALLKRFDRVSSLSPAMVALLCAKGVAPERAVAFPNWADLGRIYPLPRPNEFRDELGIADDAIVVLYAGNMGEKQGIDVVVEAARLLDANAGIVFVFAGEGASRERLQRASEGMKNLRWLPLQPVERLNALLNAADVHVLPQRADAADLVMPSKLTGMLASGRAVVGTAAAETQLGQVLDRCGVRVDPEDAAGLAAAIGALAEDAQRRDVLGRSGHRYAEEHLSMDAILSRFESALERLAPADGVQAARGGV
jgi:colanic acid biosynthesis glycosyl transferase WcaI